MNRREALTRVALIMGGTVISGSLFLEGCKPADKKYGTEEKFTPDDVAYLDEVAETIIPTTNTPGAKAAKVGAFMTVMVNDCYDEKDQKVFKEGMGKLNAASKKKFDNGFLEITPAQRTELLSELDKEQAAFATSKKKDESQHYFFMMKELTLIGYFTSEVGATQALRYLPVPGRYDGNMAYKKGDRAWATN